MSEVLHISTNDPESSAPTPEQEALLEERQAALDKAASFLSDQIPALCQLTGMDVYVAVGKGWATATRKLVRSPSIRHFSLRKAIRLTTASLLPCMS